MNAVVLTSENAEAFYAKKLNLASEPAAAVTPEKVATEPAVESARDLIAEPSVEAGEQQSPEGKQKVNQRFSELTEKIKAADAEAVKAKAEAQAERESRNLAEKRAQEATAKAAALEAKLNPPKPEGSEPKSEQFTDAFEYAKALAEWSTETALAKRDKEEAEKQSNAAREKVTKAWIDRQNALKAETPEYEAEVAKSSVVVSDQVRDAIIESEVGPKILLHLARNPEIGTKLAGLSVNAALREIGKLEAKFETKDAPAVVGSEPSRAPAPINPLRGNGAAVESVPSDGDFSKWTHAQWRAARRAGKI